MTSTTLSEPLLGLRAWRLLPVLVVLGAALNGFTVRIVEAIQTGTGAGLALGASPFELIAVGVGAYLIATAQHAELNPPRLPVFEGAALLALLVPSSLFSWLVLVVYSAYLTWRTRGQARQGAMLVLALAVCAIWASILIRWFAVPLTSAEAALMTGVLSLLDGSVSAAGNLIMNGQGHDILLLARCSSASLLPMAMVAYLALVLLDGSMLERRRILTGALGLAGVLVAANWVRLSVMLISAEWYEIGHGPIGASLFDVVQTGVTVAAAWRATKS